MSFRNLTLVSALEVCAYGGCCRDRILYSAIAVNRPITSMLMTSCNGTSKTKAKAAVIATARKTETVKPKSANRARTSTSKDTHR